MELKNFCTTKMSGFLVMGCGRENNNFTNKNYVLGKPCFYPILT